MVVLDDGPARDNALGVAHRDHGQLTIEIDERLEDQRDPAAVFLGEVFPGVVGVGLGVQHPLTLAVVPAAARLQDRGQPTDCRDRRIEIVRAVDRRELRCAHAEAPEGLLLDQAVLGHFE